MSCLPSRCCDSNGMYKEPSGIRILIGLKCFYLVDILRGENLCTSELLFASIIFLTISILGRFYLRLKIIRKVYEPECFDGSANSSISILYWYTKV